MSEEALKHYNEFIKKFTEKHGITIQEAETHIIVQEYIKSLTKEFPQ